MIHEMRTYQLHPGKAPEFLRFYEQNGLGIIGRYAKLTTVELKEGEIVAISKQSQVIRVPLSEIALSGRSTQGSRIMKLRPGDSIASLTAL